MRAIASKFIAVTYRYWIFCVEPKYFPSNDEFNLGEDKELNFPSSDQEMNHKHERWILEKLAEEESWGYF